jgi:hypothetical protein
MWLWLVRQYNDIRGNFKWAILLGLWWAISHYGKKMLELIPNIPPWTVWTLIVIVSAAAFVWISKVGKGLQVVTAIQSGSAQPSGIVPGIPTLSALLGQNPNIDLDAKKVFALAYYSPITAETEKNIKLIAQQNSPNDKEAFYARFIGIGLVAYQHDVSWFTIYGSQLSALSYLNVRGVVPIADLKQFYDKAVVDFPKTFANYSFDQWVSYMKDRMLIATYPTQMCELSFNGKDFIKYLAHTGRDIHGKAN